MVNHMSDEAWNALPEPVQVWANEVLATRDNDKKHETLLLVEGEAEEEEAESEAEEAEAESEEAEAETEAEPPKKVAKPKTARASKEKESSVEKRTKTAKPKVVAKPKVAKPEKPAKAAKPKAKNGGTAPRGRQPMFADDAKIKILAKENPHRSGTRLHKLFDKYENGMTVAEAIEAGIPRVNIRYLAATEVIAVR